MATVTIIAVYT